MTHIIYKNQKIKLNQGQTVLSALLEHGHNIPNGCQAGVCQSCLMQAIDGELPESAQAGLKDTLKSQGYFMACSCQPNSALHIRNANQEHTREAATVISHTLLRDDILRLRLKPVNTFNYHGGQYISLWMHDETARSYSLASVAELDDYLELHIRRVNYGKVSNWLHDDIKPGDSLQIQAAMGDCFYLPEHRERKIILAGTGTGLAPLIAIARDALHHKHKADIHLIHGAIKKDALYMHQYLLELATEYNSFHYHANVVHYDSPLNTRDKNIIRTGPIEQQIEELANDLSSCKIYLCGDEKIVNHLKTSLFLAGASMQNIYADPFISTPDK